VIWNIEKKSAAERDIEDLDTFADRENRLPIFETLSHRCEFPLIPLRVRIPDEGSVWNGLIQKPGGYVGPSREKKAVDFLRNSLRVNRRYPGVDDFNIGMSCKKAVEISLVFSRIQLAIFGIGGEYDAIRPGIPSIRCDFPFLRGRDATILLGNACHFAGRRLSKEANEED